MDISNAKLPPIYKRNSKDCYLDPIRKRLIYITPEETVRQRVISYLLDTLMVPADMLQVEEHLSHYGIDSKERADIVVLGKNKGNEVFPLTVIECKAPNIPLDESAVEQALKYSDSLGSVYTLVINSVTDYCYKYDEEKNTYIPIETLPEYKDMLTGDCIPIEEEELPNRIPFDELEKELKTAFDESDVGFCTDISKYTPLDIALPVFNLWEGLLDVKVKMPKGNYGLFELKEDYGVRMLTYGNAAGGQFYGPYRSFLVDIDGSTEIFSVGISTYLKSSRKNDMYSQTCINVAHDDEKIAHHALQLIVDEDAVVNGKTVRFYHNGRIAIGRIGSGKKSELKELVNKRYPKIVTDRKYFLGSITADHLLRLDEPDVIDLIVNLISYSIVRDEMREMVKARR